MAVGIPIIRATTNAKDTSPLPSVPLPADDNMLSKINMEIMKAMVKKVVVSIRTPLTC